MCLSGGFRKDPRPCAQGRTAMFRLNVPPILLLTTRAGMDIWRCLIGGFREILDHARWGGQRPRKCLLLCHPDGAQPPSLRLRLPPRAFGAPCQYFRDAAAQRFSLRSCHRKLALPPTCKGSRGGRASEVAPSEAQGGGRGITRMAEHRGRNRRRHFRLLEACCACCSRWRL